LSSKYWLVRKVICLVGYYGGFRNVELKSLLFENVECDSMGYWFTFSRSKQRNRLEETTICVPRRQKDWLPCVEDSARRAIDYDPASLIDCYLEAVMQDLDLKREDLKGGFFKGTHGKSGKRFVNTNIGKNTLACVGVEIASELCLRAPETYTGHCWRRSAGTNASNSGVNVTTLMSMMGWSCPKTAIQYVKRSRITSLKMSMYLANVQRRNCRDPFPCNSVRVSRKKVFRVTENEKDNLKDAETVSREKNRVDCVSSEQEKIEPEVGQRNCSEFVNSNLTSEIEVSEPAACLESRSVSCSARVNANNSDSDVVNSVNHTVSSGLTDLSAVDSRLLNVFQNLQNHGKIEIHFHFGDAKK